jgi:formyltetrahydrofolate synthetase
MLPLFIPVMDTNDRFLRKITIGQGKDEKNMTRQVRFAVSFMTLGHKFS